MRACQNVLLKYFNGACISNLMDLWLAKIIDIRLLKTNGYLSIKVHIIMLLLMN